MSAARLRPFAYPGGLALLVLFAAALATRYGVRVHLGQGDEFLNVLGARYVEQDPGELLDSGLFNRGPERLTAVALLLANVLLPSSTSEMQGGHFVLGVGYALVAIPAAVLVRGLGGSRWAAVGAAGVCLLSPWLVFATSYLNVTLAVSSTAALFLATWWAALHPGWRGDVWVLVAAVVAVLCRSGTLPLLAVPAIVLVAQTIRVERNPLALVRRHPVLVVVGTVFAVAVLVAGPRAFVGPAYARAVGALPGVDVLWDYTAILYAQLALGSGWLPMVIGLPWVLTQLVRPADDRTFAFAVTAVSAFVVFVLVAAQAGAQTEERYIAVLAVLAPVAFVAAVARREVQLIPTLIAAAVTARVVSTRGSSEGLLEFVAPARRLYDTVLAGRVSLLLDVSPGTARTVLLVGLVVVAGGVAFLLRKRPRPAAIATVAGVLLFGLFSAANAMDRWSRLNAPDIPWSALTWVDRASDGAHVALWNENADADPGRPFEGEQIKFFNSGLRTAIDATLRDDEASGRLDLDGARWVLTWAGQLPLLLDIERTIEHPAVFGPGQMVLHELRDPPSVLVERVGPRNGLLGVDDRATLRVTEAGRRRGGCLQVSLSAPEELDGRTTVRFSGRENPIVLRAAETKVVTLPLRDDIVVRARGRGRVVALDRPTSVLLGPLARTDTGC